MLLISEDGFNAKWRGDVVFIKRTYSALDPDQPFGLRWFIPEILRQRKDFQSIAVAVMAMHVLALAVPVYFQIVIDKVLVHHIEATLWVLTTGVAIAIGFSAAFEFLRQYLLLRASNKIDLRLARRTFAHLLALPINFFDGSSAGVLVRHMQQAERVRQFLAGRLFLTVLDLTALIVFVPMLFLYSVQLTLLVLGFVACIMLVMVVLIGPYRRRLRHLYESEARKQAMLVETIHGIRTVKALTIEPVQRQKWEQRTATAVATNYRVGTMSLSARAITGFIEKLMTVAIIAVGAQAVFSQAISVGALIAFQMIAGRVIGPLVQLVSLIHEYQETALSVRMLGEVMNRPPERQDSAGGLQPTLQGGIEFEHVSFRYVGAGAASLKDASFVIEPGQVIGIVGRSGSGKTTLTRLIQGMYNVDEGLIRFDGVDQREIDIAHLRRSIGVVLQESFLFHGTIRENIAAARPESSFEAIVEAARTAGADEFIERLPRGYDTMLEENGENLSGGQRQRLAIARALVAKPRILVLDEAVSALDPESEAIFLANLSRIASGRTVIIVSHRLSTLVDAHTILVLERGEIVSAGRHQDLLASSSHYQTLWKQQARILSRGGPMP
jgi:ATP-binding cassette subfamily B protein